MQNQQSSEKNLQVTKFQKFETVTIHRSEIKNAPYNPRHIDKSARVKLKNKIEKDGLVEALTWNSRTGNLVSGHQRISILDDLNETQNYSLTVCKIDVSEKKEKELNVFLNNPSAQGVYDFDSLKDILSSEEITLDNFGFDKLELDNILGIDSTEEFFNAPAAQVSQKEIDLVKQRRAKMKEDGAKRDNVDYYLILVFQDSKSVDSFLEKLKLPKDNKYIDGKVLTDFIGL
jgi:hypothetical protein